MSLDTELFRTPVVNCSDVSDYTFLSHRNIWWSHKVYIGWMMVLSIYHYSWLNTYALVGPQMYRNGSSYWSIHNFCINHCLSVLRIYSPFSYNIPMESESEYWLNNGTLCFALLLTQYLCLSAVKNLHKWL